MIDDIFRQPVAILRNFQRVLGINRELFAPELLQKNYGNALVDVVNQDPNASFMEQNHKTKQIKRQIKLKDFVEYQLSHEESHIEHITKNKKQQNDDHSPGSATAAEGECEEEDEEQSSFDEDKNVDFCVNVDIGGW